MALAHKPRLAWQPVLRVQSDERLVELAASGFEPAFEVLVARHRAALTRYCARIVAEDRAEDVVQQTFIRAYEAISAGRTVDRLRPWLFRVAHNGALDVLRDRALTHVELDDQLNGVERPDQAFERGEDLRGLVSALNALPTRQRDAIVLRELEGRSYDEIAREMGVTGGAVRQLLSRARTAVRAGCSAVTPYSLLGRMPWSSSEPVTARFAEVIGGTGAPVVVAQVCAAAIVTCAGGVVGIVNPKAGTDTADASPALTQPLDAFPPLADGVVAGRAPQLTRNLLPSAELPPSLGGKPVDDGEHGPAVPEAEGPAEAPVPVPAPKAPDLPTDKAPAGPPHSGEYAYPVGLGDPLACPSGRRARAAACDGGSGPPPDDAPPPEPEAQAPQSDPPPAEPAPAPPPPKTPGSRDEDDDPRPGVNDEDDDPRKPTGPKG